MRRLSIVALVAVTAVAILSTTGQAEWAFSFAVNDGAGSTDIMYDSDGVSGLPQGNIVYLIGAGANDTPEGIDLNGNLLGDDYVVALFGGGDTTFTVGDVDVPPFNMIDAGETSESVDIEPTLLQGSGWVYAIAFNTPVTYGGGAFSGLGYWGTSADIGVAPDWDGEFMIQNNNDSWVDNGGWATDQPLVPEPTTVALMIAGVGGIVAYRRKRLTAAA
jgi:hypothetical protein